MGKDYWEADPTVETSIEQFMTYVLPGYAKMVSYGPENGLFVVRYEWRENGVLHKCRVELPLGTENEVDGGKKNAEK